MNDEIRKARAIRMTEQEWSDFKSLLGPAWLRKQISNARKRERKDASHA